MRNSWALLVVLFACTPTSAQNGDGGTKDANAEAAAKPLSCAAIFDCAEMCNDDPCSDACLARGSMQAQQAALALAKCFTDNKCMDATCLKTNCQSEVDTCITQGQPNGTPLDDASTMMGNVPTAMVGSWVHAAWGETNRIVLNADGTGYYQNAYANTSNCGVSHSTVWKGAAVVDATTITIYGTTVTNTKYECGQKSELMGAPETMKFTYAFDGKVLTAIDAICAAKYPDSPSSQALYCKNTYDRE